MNSTGGTFDSSEFLESEEAIEEYLKATCEDGSAIEIAHAREVIARSRNMTRLAEDTGLSRQALYKALSGDEPPS